jgi:DNA-binding transcriptional MerR regulator
MKAKIKSIKEIKKDKYQLSDCVGCSEEFIKELNSYSRHSVSSGLSKLLNDPTAHLKNQEITARQVNSWDEYGLIGIEREGVEWRKYSIVDAVWLNTIYELRQLGIPVDIIRNVKQALEKGSDWTGTPMPLLEFCIYRAINHKDHIVLLVFSDGSAMPITYEQYFLNVYHQELKNHVLIDLSHILQRNFEANKQNILNKSDGKELGNDDKNKLTNFIKKGSYEKTPLTINGERITLNIKKFSYDALNNTDFKNTSIVKKTKK